MPSTQPHHSGHRIVPSKAPEKNLHSTTSMSDAEVAQIDASKPPPVSDDDSSSDSSVEDSGALPPMAASKAKPPCRKV